MLIVPDKPFHSRRARVAAPGAAPPRGPVLSEADFSAADGKLILSFDRDVVVDGFDPAAVVVDDPDSGLSYRAVGASVISGSIVSIVITADGPSAGTRTVLDAAAGNGIVAAEDGTPWAGASGLGLPFP